MNGLNIYSIEQEYISLAQQIIDNGGECSPELETALQINQKQLETKGRSYGFVIKTLESEVEIIDSEISRLGALKKARNKTVDKLKDVLTSAMNLFEITEIKTATIKINFRKSESIEITDERLLDRKFIKSKITESIDKIEIKKAIKEGEDVQGAILQVNQNIQIK